MRKSDIDRSLITAKNLIRPFLNQGQARSHIGGTRFQRPRPIAPNIQQLRRDFPYRHAHQLLSYVENNPLLPFDGLGSTTPKLPKHVPDGRLARLEPMPLQAELKIARCRLEYHAHQIKSMLIAVREIDQEIGAGRYSNAELAIDDFIATYGLSYAISKRRVLVALLKGGLTALQRIYNNTIKGDSGAWSVMTHAFYDLADPSYAVDRSIFTWLRPLSKLPRESRWYSLLFFWELLAEVTSTTSLADTLMRYSFVSILDYAIFCWESHCLYGSDIITEFGEFLPEDILSYMEKNFTDFELPSNTVYQDEQGIKDIDIYRLSFFFREYKSILLWQNDINQAIILNKFGQQKPLARKNSSITAIAEALRDRPSSFEAEKENIIQWASANINPDVSIKSFSFSYAITVAEFCRVSAFNVELDEKLYCDILASAEGYHEYSDIDTLRRRSIEAEEHGYAVLSFLLKDAVFRQTRNADDDLERRLSFMEIFPSRKAQDIVSTIRKINLWSESTARFLAKAGTRTFLERLFLIMTSVKDVIETRQSIAHWLVGHGEEDSRALHDEVKALKSELDNLDVRSDLDSTRVHVDEDALREWFEENQFALVGRYVQTVLSEGPSYDRDAFLSSVNRIHQVEDDRSDAFLNNIQINPEHILLNILESMLSSFVSDRIFGLDAYLSRRIRHGSLSGFLLTPLTRILKLENIEHPDDGEGQYTASIEHGRETLLQWQQSVTEALDQARRNALQIKSKEHPDGLIEATWRSASGIFHIDATFAKIRSEVVRTKGKYDLFNDLYALCWDLIERDLAKVRMFLLREFYKTSIDGLDTVYASMPSREKVLLRSTFENLRASLHSRTLEVCGWFIRPVFRQDTYGVRTLVQSIISVIRDLDDTAEFTEVIEIGNDLNISRGAFEIVGDILFVIIGNAAKHGRKGGEITIEAEAVGRQAESVHIRVISSVDGADALETARRRITAASTTTTDRELEDASVQEGFSGIRKAIVTLGRVQSGVARWGFGTETCDVMFEFAVPREIIYRRSR